MSYQGQPSLKIEALKGLGIGSSIGRMRNLLCSKSKPKSATSLSSSKQQSNNAIHPKNQAREEVYLVISPPNGFFFLSCLLFFFSNSNTIVHLMKEHDVEARERLEVIEEDYLQDRR